MSQTDIFLQRDDALWTAARTKPRCEKVVDGYCSKNGIVSYLPVRRRAQRYQRRTVETFLPLFPGYLFVQLGESEKSLLLRSNRIAHILPIDRLHEEVLIGELQELLKLERLSEKMEVIVKPEIVPGSPVYIASGALQGLRGIVERRQNVTRLTINVELLGHSASVEVDVEEVDVE